MNAGAIPLKPGTIGQELDAGGTEAPEIVTISYYGRLAPFCSNEAVLPASAHRGNCNRTALFDCRLRNTDRVCDWNLILHGLNPSLGPKIVETKSQDRLVGVWAGRDPHHL